MHTSAVVLPHIDQVGLPPRGYPTLGLECIFTLRARDSHYDPPGVIDEFMDGDPNAFGWDAYDKYDELEQMRAAAERREEWLESFPEPKPRNIAAHRFRTEFESVEHTRGRGGKAKAFLRIAINGSLKAAQAQPPKHRRTRFTSCDDQSNKA